MKRTVLAVGITFSLKICVSNRILKLFKPLDQEALTWGAQAILAIVQY